MFLMNQKLTECNGQDSIVNDIKGRIISETSLPLRNLKYVHIQKKVQSNIEGKLVFPYHI